MIFYPGIFHCLSRLLDIVKTPYMNPFTLTLILPTHLFAAELKVTPFTPDELFFLILLFHEF